MMVLRRCIGPVAMAAFLSGGAVLAQTPESGPPVPETIEVTIDNFVRAATDVEFAKYSALAGGVNRFFHFREPTPVQSQPTIRMNRDTLYSAAIVDISEGATLTLPDAGDRYMTAMVVNQDHYTEEVFFGGGTHTLDMATFGTPYVAVFLRVLVDASDPQDVAAVNALQDRMSVEAGSAAPFVVPPYDRAAFDRLLHAVIELGSFAPDSFRVFGKREDVGPLRHFIGTAVGWGGLPETEAFYLSVDPGLPVGAYAISVPADVPVGAFWSVSLYNAAGFFEPNPEDAYVVNSVMGTRNDDGSMTVHLGGCGDGRVNCLPIMDGWNYTVRLYRPGPEILDGRWSFPAALPAD
ncbi:MAG: DUF1214 domain-containing protein [Rhodobacteraceae bacterium]|nr:DUF1214 domain-containing protein [Paracoccaceae bacterium]